MTDRNSGQRPEILVVDDCPDLVNSLARLLRLCGYSVNEACDGKYALGIVAAHCPSVTLMDTRMPGTDGIELLRQLKVNCPRTAVIVMTDGEEIEKARDSGAWAVVRKRSVRFSWIT